ncbi:MAG TPA: adenylate/guanylate cyclase domain-containing protein [Actinomycetota bacterium]|nr:adenylate/guanylate cyclase domain-containing protein [Actinomycetota bacterium]
MSSPPSHPEDPRLAVIATEIAKTRWAVALCDSEWRLVWVSDELMALLRNDDPEELGYGRHMYENYMAEQWRNTITDESQIQTVLINTPYIMHDTPGGREGITTAIGDQYAPLVEQIESKVPPPVWAAQFDFLYGDLPPLKVNFVHARMHDPTTGEFIGTLVIYGSALPARVLSLVGRGDEGMFERMTRLFNPGRRPAAILFADLQASAALSRRLPSATYFKLIRALTTEIDNVVVAHRGIVGKHAGDGVTAFFLRDELGSASAAARSAIEAARDIGLAAQSAAKDVGEQTGLIQPEECLVNVGIHWGGTLYMGQLVTGGRLEVTALGDEVNECARIQQSARDGAALASKSLIEHLDDADASALGIAEDVLVYRTVSELPGVTEKAARDAGGIPVVPV